MKKNVLFFLLISSCLFIQAQQSKTSQPKNYILSGTRHGISFFPLVRYADVCYEAGDSLTFDKYHTYDVINEWMRRWAAKYPDLVEFYEAGKSLEGRSVYQLTITNKKSGRDTDKPAAYFEGGRHSGEVTATESALWLANHLLTRYGIDSAVTRLVDTKTFYIRPVNNPDGNCLYLNTAQSNRSTVRPVDNDGDGLLDEDAPEDVDGDGLILTMRWKDEKKGSWVPDTLDKTGRLLRRVSEGKGIYSTATEGWDNDGDGRINEDGIGGLDLHRNYPENWRPSSEASGRGYTQGGAGEYPLSEAETRSVVLFLLSHPNVYVVNSMDTSVPMHLRPPSTSGSEERMYPEDLAWYRKFDEAGKKITGYSRAGDVYNDYGSGEPLFGHGPDFGYFYFGAIWYGDELWNSARNKDYNGDGKFDQAEILRWDDEENDSMGFREWKAAKHPVYGEIEIGGFNPKFFQQNPPARHLEPWIRNEAMFNLLMAEHLPLLEWNDIRVKKTKTYRADSSDYQVTVRYRNSGSLPTALRQAYLVKIVRSDRVVLEIDTAGIKNKTKSFLFLPGEKEKRTADQESRQGFGDASSLSLRTSLSKDVSFTGGGETTEAVFGIRVYGDVSIRGKASVISTRGGVLKDRVFSLDRQ
ncbi:MAG: M14 family metallopeptidase [Bacteroidales bacterium]|nr:M14 family metallopeptidase [Bacteroidales bacterium]